MLNYPPYSPTVSGVNNSWWSYLKILKIFLPLGNKYYIFKYIFKFNIWLKPLQCLMLYGKMQKILIFFLCFWKVCLDAGSIHIEKVSVKDCLLWPLKKIIKTRQKEKRSLFDFAYDLSLILHMWWLTSSSWASTQFLAYSLSPPQAGDDYKGPPLKFNIEDCVYSYMCAV